MKITEEMLETFAAVILMAESDIEFRIDGGATDDPDERDRAEETVDQARTFLSQMQSELDSEAE